MRSQFPVPTQPAFGISTRHDNYTQANDFSVSTLSYKSPCKAKWWFGGRVDQLQHGTSPLRTSPSAWLRQSWPWQGYICRFMHLPKATGPHLPRRALVLLTGCLFDRSRLAALRPRFQTGGLGATWRVKDVRKAVLGTSVTRHRLSQPRWLGTLDCFVIVLTRRKIGPPNTNLSQNGKLPIGCVVIL